MSEEIIGDPPACPAHVLCRCILLPQTLSYKELGLDMDEIEEVYRPWMVRMNRNVGAGGNRKILSMGFQQGEYSDWFNKLSAKQQRNIVGARRAEMIQRGELNFKDIVDKRTGRLFTIKELQSGNMVAAPRPIMFGKGRRLPHPVRREESVVTSKPTRKTKSVETKSTTTKERVTKEKVVKEKVSKEKVVKEKSRVGSKEISSVIPTPPKDIENDYIGNARKSLDRKFGTEGYKEERTKHFQKLVDEADLYVRVSSDTLENGILVDGRFKNQFEAGKSSSGDYNPEAFKKEFSQLYGIKGKDPKNFPIFGYVSNSGNVPVTKAYGDVIVKLKSENLKSRTSVLMGDSHLNTVVSGRYPSVPSPANKADWKTVFSGVDTEDLKRAKTIDSLVKREGMNTDSDIIYIEAQYWGGVSTKDIDTVTFTKEKRVTTSLTKQLDKLGIKWSVDK